MPTRRGSCVLHLLSSQEPDFLSAHQEALRFLQDLVRIDTSSPPGNETEAARYIQGVLAYEGIESQIYEREPGRGNLVARLEGNGSKRPILLMGHLDVVGVEPDAWTEEPFGAVIKDGYLYGRGSQDDKGMVAVALEVFLMLHRSGMELDRDVILMAEAGEEGSPQLGVQYMIDEHFPEIDAEFALNEGGSIIQQNDRWVVSVATTEKVSRRCASSPTAPQATGRGHCRTIPSYTWPLPWPSSVVGNTP